MKFTTKEYANLFGDTEVVSTQQTTTTKGSVMNLPDIEIVSAAVHEAWMDGKRANGVTTRKAEDGEELMVPYDQLTEKSKELDRGTVKAVYKAIERCA